MLPAAAAATVCVLVFSAGKSEAVQKRWVRTWDLDSLDNWQGRRLPCAGKAAVLDRYPHTSMFLGDLLTLGSVELPVEGELIFGDGANMVFDHVAKDDCQDATWTHRGLDHWWDPESWEYPGFPDPASSPVPHINRVPCTRDGAVFTHTSGSVYRVHLSPPAISVSNLSVGNKNFTTSEFAAFTRTTEGKFRFVGVSSSSDNAPLYVESPGYCNDITGCLCGIETAASVICRIMSSKCVQPQCDNAIKMTGFCCPVCGAEMTISHNGTLPLASVVELLKDFLNTPGNQHISGYATKMADGHFHVYFTAVNENGDYKTASEVFKIKFEQELNTGKSHLVLITSTGAISPSVLSSVSPHNVAATFITLAVCLALGVTVYFLHKRRATSKFSFMFRRLESSSRRVSVVSDVMGGRRPSTSSIFTYSREGGLRFLNPIFNQSMASLAAAGLTSMSSDQAPPGEQVEGQRENPMYTAYQNMTPEEQQASEDTVRARERILEAAGELVASLDSSPVHTKEVKISGVATSDLGVIEEERETKKETNDQDEGTEDSTENVDDDNTDPLGAVVVSYINEDKHDLRYHAKNEVKLAESKENPLTSKEEYSSGIDGSKSAMTVQVPVDVDNIQTDESTSRRELTETAAAPTQPTSIFELDHSFSGSSSEDDNTSIEVVNLEGFTPSVNMKFDG